jgi:hypothetical protein
MRCASSDGWESPGRRYRAAAAVPARLAEWLPQTRTRARRALSGKRAGPLPGLGADHGATAGIGANAVRTRSRGR